jgi:hypothetical protein
MEQEEIVYGIMTLFVIYGNCGNVKSVSDLDTDWYRSFSLLPNVIIINLVFLSTRFLILQLKFL